MMNIGIMGIMGAAAPDAQYLYQFLLTVGFLVSLITNVVLMIRGGKSQKREVSFADQFASKEAFDKHERENKKEHAFLHQRISDGDHRLAEELNVVGKELSGVRASNDIQTQHLLRVEAKIDRAIERGHES